MSVVKRSIVVVAIIAVALAATQQAFGDPNVQCQSYDYCFNVCRTPPHKSTFITSDGAVLTYGVCCADCTDAPAYERKDGVVNKLAFALIGDVCYNGCATPAPPTFAPTPMPPPIVCKVTPLLYKGNEFSCGIDLNVYKLIAQRFGFDKAEQARKRVPQLLEIYAIRGTVYRRNNTASIEVGYVGDGAATATAIPLVQYAFGRTHQVADLGHTTVHVRTFDYSPYVPVKLRLSVVVCINGTLAEFLSSSFCVESPQTPLMQIESGSPKYDGSVCTLLPDEQTDQEAADCATFQSMFAGLISGIVLASLCGVATIVAVAVWLVRRRRKRSSNN